MRPTVLRRRPRPYFAFVMVFVTALSPVAHAATIRIPFDQPDVRAAVAAAASGDTILFWPGSHVGGAFVDGKALTFASLYVVTGDTSVVAQTILTGDANGVCNGAPGCSGNSVLEFGAAASGSAVVGLTLTKGENGVGSASRVDIVHCRVIANGDGADYTTGSGGTFRSSVFRNNRDDGIDLNGPMTMAIIDNDIVDNSDDGIEYRVYAFAGPAQPVDIIGNRISGNHEDGIQLIDYPGAGNYRIRIDRNLFQANYDPTGLSAAIAFMPNGETIETLVGAPSTRRTYVTNNTFVADKNGVVGGANSIVLNNIFTGLTGIALSKVGGNSISSYNLFWACGTNYSQSVIDTPHLLFANPQLTSTARLTVASPAINAGTAFYQWHGETVLDLPPTSYADGAPDLGAFESAPNAAPVVNAGPDRTVSLSADVVDAGTPGAPPMRADAPLAGSVSDDGLPYPPAPSILWTAVSGPGPVLFQNPMAPDARATFSVPGNYVLQLTVFDGSLTSSDQVQVTVLAPVNLPPFADAGHDQTITLPGHAQLAGLVLDDGLPKPPGAVSTTWSPVSGPRPVTFLGGATQLSPRAAFSVPGTYVLRLTASDGEMSATDTVTITVLPVANQSPSVDAGPDQTVTLPADAILDGTVADDGLPQPPGTVSASWTLAGGPGPVTFANANAIDTRATFTVPGTYLLRLTASDSQLAASDTVTVTVLPVPNAPPAVDAGPDQSFMFPLEANLDGTVSDDGLPDPPAAVTTAWTVASGPSSVTFQNAAAVDTRASFGAPGTYILRLSASDGARSASDSVAVIVQPPPPAFEGRISAASDDAEEDDKGRIGHGDTDLDMMGGIAGQFVGLRFTNVTVPPGATILAAYVQFKASGSSSGATSLTLQGQATDNATTFGISRKNISLRPLTSAMADWAPPDWTTAGQAGPAQRTADLAGVIQEIIDRPGWTSGNAMAIIIGGSGNRIAHSYETDPSGAALLHIDFGGLAAPAAAQPATAAPTSGSAVVAPVAPAPLSAMAATAPRLELALHGVSPQPSRGSLLVAFALAGDGPAALELHDVAGRRVAWREVGSLGPGAHTIEFSERLPAGIYLVRLTQGGRTLMGKAIVIQ